jgi:uncharacterized protein
MNTRFFIRGLVGALSLVVLVCIGVMALFYFGQEKLIFQGTPLPASHQFNLPDTTEVTIPVAGATLSALHFRRPNREDTKGVIFFLHGNAGNLASWLANVDFYRANKFDLFMIDYRGFGKSTGTIQSEAELHQDVLAAWQFIAPQYAGKKRVIFSRSLGTTLAAKLATEVNVDWLVMASPFYSLESLRREYYPLMPAALMRYEFPTNVWLPKSSSPITILHGDIDSLIDFTHAQRLQALMPQAANTILIKINGGTHLNLQEIPAYGQALAAGLSKL